MSSANTSRLASNGVSVWLDDLSRSRLDTGSLSALINESGVVGITTNPAIFARAISQDAAYDSALTTCRAEGLTSSAAVMQLAVDDVQRACDLLEPVWKSSDGIDGRVSIEVEPELAHDVDGTVSRARQLWEMVDRPNVMIKIPATPQGVRAVSQVIAEGISVNVTLIFSLHRYREVVNAYLLGLELARKQGHDITQIHSVASFFISRLDTAVDEILEADGSLEALALRGKAGIANARLAYEVATDLFSTARAKFLLGLGAHRQRLLWASTGVKNPEYPDTMYVDELVAPHTVNTMPEETLRAVIAHSSITGDTISPRISEANQVLNELEHFGVNYSDVTNQLEREGLEKFADSWNGLLSEVKRKFEGAI